jgi:Transposase DDE domain/Transposase domain (DUF772)
MTLGLAQRQGDLLDEVTRFCEEALPEASVYGLLHRERDRLFPDELFADLFAGRGRRCVPPSVVATVMVLQRLEGLSDREAVERYTFDARWRYAAGVGGYGGGWGRFAHTVLVDMRERLRRSDRPDRVFEVALAAARQAGLVGRRRVLDSTPLYDAVATMDTVTLIGSALRGLLAAADQVLEAELRAVLGGSDDYASAAKPQIDWDDPAAREALVDSRATDARACLAVLDGCQLDPVVAQAAALLAAVVGQDLDQGEDGRFRIARKVAADRVISTVDPDARHGHKTSARGFDGYKGHASVDPDSELICATAATAGNVGDAAAAPGLLAELVAQADGDPPASVADPGPPAPTPTVYGDSAYGTGPLLADLHAAGIDPRVKVQAAVAPGGHFTKDQFGIDLAAGTVTCPAQHTAPIVYNPNPRHRHHCQASFGEVCASCPLADRCTKAAGGRTITITAYEAELAAARARQADPDRAADYRATRPKVERKLAHLVRRRHGGRRVRVRGLARVAADFNLLAAAVNLARLGVLGLHWTPSRGWAPA